MASTTLLECARCSLLVHAADARARCPSCGLRMRPGLVAVGFADAVDVLGAPGDPWAPPVEAPAKERAYVHRCADGHKASSLDEVRIDDWLHEHGILHEREPKLKGMRPDWRVGDVYIEFWGLAGAQGYEKRREEKLALYRRRGLKLVELFPEDVAHLDTKLGHLPSVVTTLDSFTDRARVDDPRR